MAWQKYPVSLGAWKKSMRRFGGTTFLVARDFKSRMPITPELAAVCCEHGCPRDAVYAIQNGWLSGVWIDGFHNYQAALFTDKELGEWVQVVSIDGKPWWGDIARRARQLLATLGHWLTVLGLLIACADNMLFE